MRLRDGDSASSGRLEVRQDEEPWGTVCLHDWNANAAAVACHFMGYTGGSVGVYDGSFGEGHSDILVSFHITQKQQYLGALGVK